MPLSFSFGRADHGVDTFVPAAQTTLVAAATEIAGGLNLVTPVAGSTAVTLPKDAAVGSTITIVNLAASAVTLLVFPPFNRGLAVPAAAGGRIFGSTAGAITANASQSLAQGKAATFYPHPNGIDFTVVIGA